MSISIWNLQDARHRLLSGDFNTPGNWLGGVPTSASTILLNTGSYTVTATLSGAAQFDGLSIAAGAGFAASVDASLVLDGLSIAKYGSLSLARNGGGFATLSVDHLTNSGTISAPGCRLSYSGSGGTEGWYNAGTLDLRSIGAPTLDNIGRLILEGVSGATLGSLGTVENESTGLVAWRNGSTAMGSWHNAGTFEVDAGTVTFSNDLQNLRGGALTGGTWVVDGGLQVATSATDSAPITSLVGADVTLGTSAAAIGIGSTSSSAGTLIQSSLALVDTHSALRLLGGYTWSAGHALTLNGTLELAAAGYGGDITAGSKSHITGTGLLTGDMVLNGGVAATAGGTITVEGGTDDLSGKLTGAGTITFRNDTLHVEAASSWSAAHLSFDNDTITMDGTRSFGGSLAFTDGMMTLTAGAKLVATGDVSFAGLDLTGAGTLQLSGATTSDGITAIEVATRNDGTVTVHTDLLSMFGALTGSGHFVIGDEAQLNLHAAVARGTVVDMTGTHAALGLVVPDSFAGVLDGFDAGDSIDVSGFAAAGTTLTFKAGAGGVGGSLTIANGSHKDVLYLGDGSFSGGAFHVADDGHGGSTITYTAPPVPTAAHVEPILATLDHHAMHYAIA